MNKTGYSLIILFLFSSVTLLSQDKSFFEKNILKVYINGVYDANPNFLVNNTTTTAVRKTENNAYAYDFGGLSIAVEKNIGKHFRREMEWLPVRLKFTDSETKQTRIDENIPTITNGSTTFLIESAIRYQINYYPLAHRNGKLNPYIGLSSRLNGIRYVIEPKVSSFKTANSIVGLSFQLIPGLEWKLNEKMYLVFDLPLTWYDLNYHWQRVDNPAVPLEQQRIKYSQYEFLPKGVDFRIGLKLDLSKN